ncbi:MAG: hypothetical protein ACJ8AT_20950 [Hyalangium sp.]|uniref:hypothetical protein n=1 Tax=Hyalangium sp. TaxID=2028555 RepID=UPI003899FBAE
MPIVLGQGCHDRSTFISSHAPNAHAPPGPTPLPANHYVVGDDFFTVKTAAELQKIIDTTVQNLKKLDFQGAQAAAAKKVLQDASGSSSTIKVRWGLHQSVDRPDGTTGKSKHFTLQTSPNDWHLYVNSDGSQIAYMSNGAGPANLVSIKRF